jgi:hypothetical protein
MLPMVLDEIEVGEAKRQSGSKHSEVFSCVERADHQKLKRGLWWTRYVVVVYWRILRCDRSFSSDQFWYCAKLLAAPFVGRGIGGVSALD